MSERVSGLRRLLKRFDTQDFVASPARRFLRDWSDSVKTEARSNVRVFSGDTKASIETEVGSGFFPKFARAYSDHPTARWLELGTGALSEDPLSSKQPYFPPPENLRDWSDSKGLDPYAVAAGIFARGGTPPTHFFSDAVETVGGTFNVIMTRFGKDIEFTAERP